LKRFRTSVKEPSALEYTLSPEVVLAIRPHYSNFEHLKNISITDIM